MDSENSERSRSPSPGSSFRGRARGPRTRGGRAARARAPRARARGRQNRAQENVLPNRAEAAATANAERRANVQSYLDEISTEELKEFVMTVYDRQPSFVLDIVKLRRIPSSSGSAGGSGSPPSPPQDLPQWCRCTFCIEMPTDRENVCCGQRPINCHSQIRDLDNIVLDEGVLEVARRMREDMLVQAEDPDYNRSHRHTAYRQYIIWIHGHLGAGNRRVVPSCVVRRIRDKYPDPMGHYVGFQPGRLG